MASPLVDALAAVNPAMPRALEAFDRIALSGALRPDLLEHSIRVGSAQADSRLTYYFDVDRVGEGGAAEVARRFDAISREIGASVPPALSELLRSGAPLSHAVRQVVLGVEADAHRARAKYYFVFRDDPTREVTALLAATATSPRIAFEMSAVYIVGIDVGGDGVEDVKLYFRLDRARLARVVARYGRVVELAEGSRDVVFQQCLRRPDRRQMYFHAKSTALLDGWLERHGYAAATSRARALRGRLSNHSVEPWIVSFPFTDRNIDEAVATVYFHVEERRAIRP